MNTFLFELGTEEIPAKMIQPALDQLERQLLALLSDAQVTAGPVRLFSSPRRLAFLLEDLPQRQEDRWEQVLGPPRSIAVDAKGRPQPAALGFARKQGTVFEKLETVETDKGVYLAFNCRRRGRPLPEILKRALPEILRQLYWPKRMYWRRSRFRFVRPIRWLVTLWNSKSIEFEFEGLVSGRTSRGHRFLGDGEIRLRSANSYVEQLRRQKVLVDSEEKRSKIAAEIERNTPPDLKVLPDAELAETVVYLNEYPSVLRGEFDLRFLEMPQEILITVMRVHQKYFALTDAQGALQPFFLTVLNTREDVTGAIRRGHERVLAARLEDAAFFWNNDQRRTLEDRRQDLAGMSFQQDLGNYLDKTTRLVQLCRELTKDPEMATAAQLCKVDLTTEMVFEMPELQGVMGGLYAHQEGHPEAVWKAIYEHYRPVSMEDNSPATPLGALLSIADKLDSVVGCFGLGIRPTSSSDPFALRRQSQGIVKVLLDHRLDLSLSELISWAQQGFPEQADPVAAHQQVLAFLRRRLRRLLSEQGFAYDVINAVMAVAGDRAHDAVLRAEALTALRREADFGQLAIAFKRVQNILTGRPVTPANVDRDALVEPAEIELHRRFDQLRSKIGVQLKAGDYLAALRLMTGLRDPVDRFFDDVMVLTEEDSLRENRLRLLDSMASLFLQVADISEMAQKEA